MKLKKISQLMKASSWLTNVLDPSATKKVKAVKVVRKAKK